MRIAYIYVLKHKTKLKYYIGSSYDPNKRILEHFSPARAKVKPVDYEMQQDGNRSDFEVLTIIECASRDDAYDMEKVITRAYKKHGYTIYNRDYGNKRGLVTRKHLSESRMGHEVSAATRKKISDNLKGTISPKRKKVYCLTTGISYDSVTIAEKETGIGHISACCRGERNYAGKVNGVPCKWVYKKG